MGNALHKFCCISSSLRYSSCNYTSCSIICMVIGIVNILMLMSHSINLDIHRHTCFRTSMRRHILCKCHKINMIRNYPGITYIYMGRINSNYFKSRIPHYTMTDIYLTVSTSCHLSNYNWHIHWMMSIIDTTKNILNTIP